MLDQLRAMGVFACVVEKSSFSGAARELGITTSAVSQQIRSLENDMGVTLLHRSTRKLSLTEAGKAFFHSCQEMLAAAERGKIKINQLKDDLIGDLHIVAPIELAMNHVIPALTQWMSAHRSLAVHFDTHASEASTEAAHIELRLSADVDDDAETVLAQSRQILVATPRYLNQFAPILHPLNLNQHELIPVCGDKNMQQKFIFKHDATHELVNLEKNFRFSANNTTLAKTFCLEGYGIAQLSYLDVQKELMQGKLVEVLPQWKLPSLTLYALINMDDASSMKVNRCVEILRQYFLQIPVERVFKKAS